MHRRKGGAAAKADEIEKPEGGGEFEFLAKIAGKTWAKITGASGDEEGIDVGQGQARFCQSGTSGLGGEFGSEAAEAGHHGVGLENESFFDAVESEMASFDAVLVAENFTKKGARAGGELVKLGGVFESGHYLGLSKSAGRDCSADGMKEHGETNDKGGK